MDKQAHKKFLLKIAKSVSDLIVGNPANKDHFRQQIKTFCETRNKFDQALKKCKKAAEDNPTLQCKDEEAKPPQKGLELESYYLLEIPEKSLPKNFKSKDFGRDAKIKRTAFWRRPLPFDPDRWLSYRYGYHWRSWLGPIPKEPQNKNQQLTCQYAVLAVIYDKELCIPVCDRLTDSAPNGWAELLWVDIKAFGYEGQTRTYGQRQNAIQLALDHVKAEASGKAGAKIVKLTDFIRENCEDTTSISSKANRIHEFVKKGKIKFMPKPVNETKGNETKLYKEQELRGIWPKLKEKIKSLPNLKD